MVINKEKKEAKKRLFNSIKNSTVKEQLESCEKMLYLYEKRFGKNRIIRLYLKSRLNEFPEEV